MRKYYSTKTVVFLTATQSISFLLSVLNLKLPHVLKKNKHFFKKKRLLLTYLSTTTAFL